LAVGGPLWLLFLMLLNGTPLGKTSAQDLRLAMAPIALFVVPLAVALYRRAPLASYWLVALAPLVSSANLALCVLVSVSHKDVEGQYALFTYPWIMPGGLVVVAALYRARGTASRSAEGDKDMPV
jgi:hypothetical protein